MKYELRIMNERRKSTPRSRGRLFGFSLNSVFIHHTSARAHPPGADARGFTIIETLVAIVILLFAISGPLTLAGRSIASAEAAREEVTALFLAQEAVEFVKNIRDENFLTGKGGERDWLLGLEQCEQAGGCGVDPTAREAEDRIILCSDASESCLLQQHQTEGIFGHPYSDQTGRFEWSQGLNQWKPSPFTREIFLVRNGSNEAEVRTVVSWPSRLFGKHSVEARVFLFNWYVEK